MSKIVRTGFESPSAWNLGTGLGTGGWEPQVLTNVSGRSGKSINVYEETTSNSADARFRITVPSADLGSGFGLTAQWQTLAPQSYMDGTTYSFLLFAWRDGSTMHGILVRNNKLIYATSTYPTRGFNYRWAFASEGSDVTTVVQSLTLSAVPNVDTWYPVSILVNNTEIRVSFDSQEMVVAGPFTWSIAELALMGPPSGRFQATSDIGDDYFLGGTTVGGAWDDVAVNSLAGTVDNGLPNFIRALPASFTVANAASWANTANLNDGSTATKSDANGTLVLDIESTPVDYAEVEGVNAFYRSVEGVGAASELSAEVDDGTSQSDTDTYFASIVPGDRETRHLGKSSEGGDWTAADWNNAQLKLTVTP